MDPRSLLAPLHLLSFSTLLGTSLYQTFVVTKICYVSLPRSAFTTLQKRLFPVYFQGQSILILLTALTIPPHGPFTLIANKAAWIPFAVAGATAALNLLVYGPRTRQIMIERIHQETRDGRKRPVVAADKNDSATETPSTPSTPSEPSAEMQRLHRSFSRNHAMSIHLNLLSLSAMLWWGWRLASSLHLELK
ncbi:hypothetical protein F4808DRAFT_457757 [Astrocystis sublimbata]|nr:hypothetical protein F4808DRAFT_457757 [Astrocystis sublimbata]